MLLKAAENGFARLDRKWTAVCQFGYRKSYAKPQPLLLQQQCALGLRNFKHKRPWLTFLFGTRKNITHFGSKGNYPGMIFRNGDPCSRRNSGQ